MKNIEKLERGLPQKERGFLQKEFEARVEKTQAMMAQKKLDAIFISTEAIFRYFTGFYTQFWASPTRPWFLIVPASGKPVGVIPSVGGSGLAATWIDEIHTWQSPCPNDDGVNLLIDVLKKYTNSEKRLGIPMGSESQIRMPYLDFLKVKDALEGVELVDVAQDLHRIRSVKSSAEIEKIQQACDIANEAFKLLPSHAKIGFTEMDICRSMRINMLRFGADRTPYLVIGTGQGGYESIIMGPTSRVIEENDILTVDTGLCYDGYYADFCRNFVFGEADDDTKHANDVVSNAVDAGFKKVRPGATTTDVYNAMWEVLVKGGTQENSVGRMGHGLGSELTEWPSITATDNTPLVEGMVITLEPSMDYGNGKSMVHEENVLVTKDGAKWLTQRAQHDLVVI